MKRFTLLLITILLIPLINNVVQAKDNYAIGRDFWIAIPPNEMPSYPKHVLELYCASAKDGTVKIYSNTGLNISKSLRAENVTSFSESQGELSWSYELRESGKVLDKAIRVYADVPFSCNVLNAKHTSSDGYLALPVNALGNKYIHASYYDNSESTSNPFKAGFVVVAHQNNTKINIKLRGEGGGFAKTEAGRMIGDSWSETLDKGQVYMVRGDGTTRMMFDLTGSEVESTKRFGFLSFHMRTPLPKALSGSRDHLVEMMAPVSAWGSEYVTVEYQRPARKGDMFRIVAAEANTKYEVKWYDQNDNYKLVDTWEGVLNKPGDFVTFKETLGDKSIFGCSVFKSYDASGENQEKPIMVMQYAYTAGWDSASNFDPFMILVSPESSYVKAACFQTPSGGEAKFSPNHFNIVAKHDPNDTNYDDLKSLTLDGDRIADIRPSFLAAKIPGTDYHWAKIEVSEGSHLIKGDGEVKFAAYIYGFSMMNSYGWPATPISDVSGKNDPLPPTISIEMEDKNIDFVLEDKIDKDFEQTGLYKIEILESENMNISNDEIEFYDKIYEYSLYSSLKDEYSPAKVKIQVEDNVMNRTLDEITVNMDTLRIEEEMIDCGYFRSGISIEKSFIISNPHENNKAKITGIECNNENVEILLDEEVKMDPNTSETISFKIGSSENEIFNDELIIKTTFIDYTLPITWNTLNSDLELAEFLNYGAIELNKNASNIINFKNITDHNLEISKIYLKNGSYYNITNNPAQTEYSLSSEDVSYVTVEYTPHTDGVTDIDTLVVEYSHGVDYIVLSGEGFVDTKVEENDLVNLHISPNPATGSNIKLSLMPETTSVSYTITDISGRELLSNQIISSNGIVDEDINISRFASGTYYIKIKDGNKIYQSSFVVKK